MLSLKYKYIFIHVPKTGGNSIKQMLKENDESYDIDIGHDTMNKALKNHLDKIDYKKIFVIRNPYDRIISFYFYSKKCKPNEGLFNKDEFMQFLERRRSYLKTQTERVNYKGEIDKTYMIRYENFEEDFRRVMKNFGFEFGELIKINTTTHKHYSYYYDNHMKKLIKSMFQEDLDNFGYEFEEL